MRCNASARLDIYGALSLNKHLYHVVPKNENNEKQDTKILQKIGTSTNLVLVED